MYMVYRVHLLQNDKLDQTGAYVNSPTLNLHIVVCTTYIPTHIGVAITVGCDSNNYYPVH